MAPTRFWHVAAILGIAAAISCSNESQGTSAAETQATPEVSQPSSAEPAASNQHAGPVPTVFDSPPPVGTRARCPVMGGEFTVTAETQRSEYQGNHYVFCCPGCKPRFDADPSNYLSAHNQPGK